MQRVSTIMVLLALPAYALPWPICPKITVGLILGAFLIGFIDAEIHRKDNQ